MLDSELTGDTKPSLLQDIFPPEIRIEIDPASPEGSETHLPVEHDHVGFKIEEINENHEKVLGGNPVFEQVFIHNPCYCECPLRDSVDWIAAFEFCWGLANAIVCIVTLAVTVSENDLTQLLQQFADAEKRLTARQAVIIKVTMILHIIECVLAWLLMVATDRRIRCLCLFWMIATTLTMTCQIILVSVEHVVATYIGIGTHPIKLYFIYVVWALAKEIRTFPGGPPIPICRQITGESVSVGLDLSRIGFKKKTRTKLKTSAQAAPVPILIPTVGWGYYPYYYSSLSSGFHSNRSPYYHHENYDKKRGAVAAAEESRPKGRGSDNPHRLSTAWSLDAQSMGGSAGVRGSIYSYQGYTRRY